MKKLFTLAFGLFTFVLFAAGRQPSVTITTSNNYEIWIDGKNYIPKNSGNTVNVPDMQLGSHTVEVYQVTNKIFRKDHTLVTRSTFNLNDRDLIINVDNNGQLNIRESGNTVNQQSGRTVTNPDGTTTTVGGNGKVGNNSDRRTRGRGHKYGHNKEWKADKMKNKNKELKNKDGRQDDQGEDNDEDENYNKDSKTKEYKSKANKNKSKGKK